jgi:hypothetical protein
MTPMENDDDLRERFRTLETEDAAGAPPFSRARLDARLSESRSRETRRARSVPRRLAIVGASVAGTVIALTIGLVWGANTGYASARVEDDRQRNETATAMTTVTSELAVLRLDLRRARLDLARRATESGAAARPSFLAAEADLRAMESNAERIELDLTQGREAAASSPAALMRGIPMKRALAITCGALALGAQAAPVVPVAPAQPGVPIVNLPPATATSTATMGAVFGVRQLGDGKLLVNDAGRRQLKLFDSTLASVTIASDSAPGTTNSYGPVPNRLIAYRGDSSLFPDIQSRTLRVLDAAGQQARAWALPNDPAAQFALILRPSAVDQKGRLLYMKDPPDRGVPAAAFDSAYVAAHLLDPHDSVEIVRADFDTRRIDTVGRVMQPNRGHLAFAPAGDGKTKIVRVLNPLLTIDEWAVLSDGTIAFVRGHDYHVDWIHPDGTRSSTAKLPFDWRRLTDDDKQRLIDSTRVAQDSAAARISRLRALAPPGGGGGRGGGGGDPNAPRPVLPPIEIAKPNEIPDYYPPIRPGAAIPDLDGNLWILPATSAQSQGGELVYDVVSPQRGLFERVRIPAGRSIAGFGKGGVVYLLVGERVNGSDAPPVPSQRFMTGFHLERTKLVMAPNAPRGN